MFIRMVTSGNHEPLTDDNWNDIMTDYLTLSESQPALRAVAHEREIYFLTNQIYLTHQVVAMVAETAHPALLDLLKSMGHRHAYTDATIDADLTAILNSLKQKEVRIGQIKHDLAQMGSTGKPPTEKDFYKQLDAIAEHRKVPYINASEITVADYCVKLSRFTEYINAQQKANGSR